MFIIYYLLYLLHLLYGMTFTRKNIVHLCLESKLFVTVNYSHEVENIFRSSKKTLM